MNYKNIASRKLQEFAESSDLTLAQILYSIVRPNNSGVEITELKNIPDEELLSIIEKAQQFEKE